MNRIDALFIQRSGDVLSVYLTAGYPEIDDTSEAIRQLEKAGADLIEIGMPFSDPLADGPLLQECNQKSLENGMSLEVLFKQLDGIRDSVSLPLILMGYLNPVLNYGFEEFCIKAAEVGVDGFILPDLPLDEYESRYKKTCEQYGLYMIFLITPQTSDERIQRIATMSRGFIYMVSAASTTGAKRGFQPEQIQYFSRISAMNLPQPRLIGFGISTADTFREACKHANGAIIGSAFMKALGSGRPIKESIPDFISSIKVWNS